MLFRYRAHAYAMQIMSTEHHFETESLVEGLEQAAQVYWPALLVEGIALMLIGVLALFIPPLITLGIATALGWLFIAGGIVALVVYSWGYAAPGYRSLLFYAALSTVAGVALVLRPLSGAISLTVILIVCFALGGVAKLFYPLGRSQYLSKYRGWIRASGVVDLVLAAFMFIGLPEIALWAPGLLLGANMVLGGAALVVVAVLERRKPASTATPASADHAG
jgi:uncharacterized membrane protein HdeD (DUF308 family)